MAETSTFSKDYAKLGVVGAGAWGTALALVAAQNSPKVHLWARERSVEESIRTIHENAQFLPGVLLPDNVVAVSDLSATVADVLLLAVPAQHLRTSLQALAPHVAPQTVIVLCAKGIEKGSGKLVTEILRETMPAAQPAILSGPSFAQDVARGLPTAVTVAAEPDLAARLQALLATASFRPYASGDLAGVALGGAAKNVYAIACGTADGLGLGDSARAALLARSFAELARFGDALGAKRETLMGLSGLGDLVLTATSPHSRNFRFGRALGRGDSLAALRQPDQPLVEGADTAPALIARARAEGIELPIAETVAAMLDGKLAPAATIERLMSRPLRPE